MRLMIPMLISNVTIICSPPLGYGDHAGKAHECHGHESCNYQGDSWTFQSWGGYFGILQFLSDSSHCDNSYEPTNPASKSKEERCKQCILPDYHEEAYSQDCTVYCYQREEDAQRLVQRFTISLQRHLSELYEGRDDDDEHDKPEILQTIGNEQVLIHNPVQGVVVAMTNMTAIPSPVEVFNSFDTERKEHIPR